MLTLDQLTDRHKGETAYIIGNSPQLNELTPEQVEKISKGFSVGVNYSYLAFPTKYWICGHLPHVRHCDRFGPREMIKFFQKGAPHDTTWECPNMNLIRAVVSTPGHLPKSLPADGFISGGEQILVSSTHLAYLMGAKRIVYIGFDQKNYSHFYQEKPEYLEQLKKDFDILLEERSHEPQFVHELKVDVMAKIFKKKEEVEKLPFPGEDITPKMRAHFDTLKNNGVEIISTIQDSLISRAGGEFHPLSEAV